MMTVITINAMRDGIGQVLSEFGYTIYDEKSEQGFEEPCFFIELVSVYQKRIGYRRLERRQQMCIHFFQKEPKTEEIAHINQDLNDMAEKLYSLLEYIKVNEGLCRGSGMNHRSDDGILHFMVSYNYQLIEIRSQEPLMSNLEHDEKLKGIQSKHMEVL